MLLATAMAQTNLVDYGPNNGTNGSKVISLPNTYFPSQAFNIQFGNITNTPYPGDWSTNGITNSIQVDWQISIDAANSNWVTLATFVPTGTNGSYARFTPLGVSTNIPQRVRVRTTNSLSVGVWTPQ